VRLGFQQNLVAILSANDHRAVARALAATESFRLSASKKQPAAVDQGGDRTALQEMADFLWSNLPSDAYQHLCELLFSFANPNLCAICGRL
jgi:hypothetical protein